MLNKLTWVGQDCEPVSIKSKLTFRGRLIWYSKYENTLMLCCEKNCQVLSGVPIELNQEIFSNNFIELGGILIQSSTFFIYNFIRYRK